MQRLIATFAAFALTLQAVAAGAADALAWFASNPLNQTICYGAMSGPSDG